MAAPIGMNISTYNTYFVSLVIIWRRHLKSTFNNEIGRSIQLWRYFSFDDKSAWNWVFKDDVSDFMSEWVKTGVMFDLFTLMSVKSAPSCSYLYYQHRSINSVSVIDYFYPARPTGWAGSVLCFVSLSVSESLKVSSMFLLWEWDLLLY